MDKRFCDLCDSPVTNRDNRDNITLAKEVLCDKKAKIVGKFILSFSGHSSGFGGPPDLCNKCRRKLLNKYKRSILND